MKEVLIELPHIEVSDYVEIGKKRSYPAVGRYAVSLPSGDVYVVDVQTWPDSDNPEEPVCYVAAFMGQPNLLKSEEWTLKTDIENLENAHKEDLEQKDLQIANLNQDIAILKKQHSDELTELEQEYERKKLQLELDTEQLRKEDQQSLATRRMELEQEYEKKKLQLELDTPKRFAQGEWVSGKTLTEIVRILTGEKKEDLLCRHQD
jgi:hypothetical protein